MGQAAAFAATNEVGATALTRVELILLPLVVAILLILYRSVAAALISLVVSVTAIVVAMGVLTWLAGVVELNVIVQSIATMLGLGVSVDYSLIMIRRFIDEVTSSDRGAALTNTMRTAGRTVAASGTTVAVALATLLIVDMPLIRSIAIAGISRSSWRRSSHVLLSFPRCCTCSVLARRLGACRGCRPPGSGAAVAGADLPGPSWPDRLPR